MDEECIRQTTTARNKWNRYRYRQGSQLNLSPAGPVGRPAITGLTADGRRFLQDGSKLARRIITPGYCAFLLSKTIIRRAYKFAIEAPDCGP